MEEQRQPGVLGERWYALRTPLKMVVVLVTAFAVLIVGTIVRSLLQTQSFGVADMGMGNSAPYEIGMPTTKMSSRVAMEDSAAYYPSPYPPQSGGVGYYDEVGYETKSYYAHIKTRAYDVACDTIESWKPLAYVVFEQSNRGDSYSAYRFKVERDRASEVLAQLKGLDPRTLNEQSEVVKRQVEEYTSQLDVLKKREALLADTLDKVSVAYDELVTLSKSAHDVETLAKVIDGKLNYIERLSQQRIQVAAELDAIARAKADLEDRIAYVYVDVSVEKIEFVNKEEIRDSWMYAAREFVAQVHKTFQQLTFGVLALVLWLVQLILEAIIFFVVVLFIVKHGWRATKKFWYS